MRKEQLVTFAVILVASGASVGCGAKMAGELLGAGMDSALAECRRTPEGIELPGDDCGTSSLGDGLVCPDSVESDARPIECKYQHEFKIAGAYPGYGDLGRAGRRARIIVATRTLKNRRVEHHHRCETDVEGSCAESFVSAEARIYQEGEIQFAWSLFGVLQWETVVRQDRHYDFCSWEDHPEPRSCGVMEIPS